MTIPKSPLRAVNRKSILTSTWLRRLHQGVGNHVNSGKFAEDEPLSPLFDLLADACFGEAVSTLKGNDVSVKDTIILED